MLKEVIRIEKVVKPKREPKPIKFTHYQDDAEGWIGIDKTSITTRKIGDIIYLGRDKFNGDMFAAKDGEFIRILKGRLNDGVYES